MKSANVFSIGYTAFPIAELISMLKQHQVNCVIDVRSLPYSQLYPDFNRESFSNRLRQEHMYYRNYANEFGARQEEPVYFQSRDLDYKLDFMQFTTSDAFQSGVSKLQAGLKGGFSFALLCAEKDPINCHRAIMVGYGLKKAGISVQHILSDGSIQCQETIEHRLLELHDRQKQRDQISLIPEENLPLEAWIERCYRKQNAVIGYRLQEAEMEEGA